MDTNQLQLENEKLNARLEKAKEVFRQQASDIKAKDNAYLKLKDEYDELIKERDTFAQDNVKLNEQISELEKQKQSISDMHNKTATALKMRDNEIEELRKNIAKFEEGNSKHDDLQEELNITKKELHIANETITEYASKCTRYDEVIKSLNEKNDDLDTLATSRLADIKKREEDIVNLNKTIGEINGTYNQLNDEHNLLLAQVKDLNDEVNSLQDNIVSKDTAYKELQDTYNNLVTEQLRYTGELNSKIEKLEGELSEKTEALDKALNEIQSLTNRLNSESGKIEEVKSKTEVAVTSIKKKLQALNDGLGEEFNIFG